MHSFFRFFFFATSIVFLLRIGHKREEICQSHARSKQTHSWGANTSRLLHGAKTTHLNNKWFGKCVCVWKWVRRIRFFSSSLHVNCSGALLNFYCFQSLSHSVDFDENAALLIQFDYGRFPYLECSERAALIKLLSYAWIVRSNMDSVASFQ